MASDTDDSEVAADRLEAALERISEALARPGADQFSSADAKQIATRLDALIDRLRSALGDTAG
ncbi:MAG TPA: hypothetical protein VFL55_10360 [Acetobacteraceae bacterium]|nr:hypothetical protein [Acetobacteraceae bacterium]